MDNWTVCSLLNLNLNLNLILLSDAILPQADVSRLLKEQSSLSARLQEAQASRIVLEEQGRQVVAAGELATTEMRKKVEEKDKEGRLASDSMARLEKELKGEQQKVTHLQVDSRLLPICPKFLNELLPPIFVFVSSC